MADWLDLGRMLAAAGPAELADLDETIRRLSCVRDALRLALGNAQPPRPAGGGPVRSLVWPVVAAAATPPPAPRSSLEQPPPRPAVPIPPPRPPDELDADRLAEELVAFGAMPITSLTQRVGLHGMRVKKLLRKYPTRFAFIETGARWCSLDAPPPAAPPTRPAPSSTGTAPAPGPPATSPSTAPSGAPTCGPPSA